jgi:hypothetical protein
MKNYIGPKSFKVNSKNKEKIAKLLNKKKSVPVLQKELQTLYNLFVRLRDTLYDKGKAYFICISCQQPKGTDQMHCGHFFSVGGHSSVRYDEFNGNGQCIYCNTYQHGNLLKYKENLIKKIGQSNFNILEIRAHNRSKMMAFELELLIQEYKNKIDSLKKERP